SLQVTVTLTATGSVSLALHEYAGVASTAVVDQTVHASGAGSLASSGTATTGQAGDLLFGASTFTDYLVESASAGARYTMRQAQPNDQCCNALFTEDGMAGAPGSYAATFTYPTPLSYRAALVAFRPASSPIATGTPTTGPSATTTPTSTNTAGPTNT